LTAKQAQAKAANFTGTPSAKTPAAPKPAPTAPSGAPINTLDLQGKNLNDPKGIIDADYNIQQEVADQNVQLGNAGIQRNPFGEQTISRDAQGNIIVDQSLSGAQQGILNRDQQLSTMGRDQAVGMFGQYFDPNQQRRALGSDFQADRARMEDEVFGRLTRGMDDKKERDRQQLEQNLHNRGIPVGSKLFDQQMEEFNQRYDNLTLDARAQATQMGGQEYERNFNIQEGKLKNELGELGYMAGFGTGFQSPQFQGYQGVQMAAPSALDSKIGIMGAKDNRTALEIQREQLDIERQKLDLQAQQIHMANKPSGGAAPKSPFNNTPVPSAPR
jgi:hypothetical protein